jgi:hypothetical protein
MRIVGPDDLLLPIKSLGSDKNAATAFTAKAIRTPTGTVLHPSGAIDLKSGSADALAVDLSSDADMRQSSLRRRTLP